MLSVFSGRFQNAMGGRFGAFFALLDEFRKNYTSGLDWSGKKNDI
jgi:hypothetical protein